MNDVSIEELEKKIDFDIDELPPVNVMRMRKIGIVDETYRKVWKMEEDLQKKQIEQEIVDQRKKAISLQRSWDEALMEKEKREAEEKKEKKKEGMQKNQEQRAYLDNLRKEQQSRVEKMSKEREIFQAEIKKNQQRIREENFRQKDEARRIAEELQEQIKSEEKNDKERNELIRRNKQREMYESNKKLIEERKKLKELEDARAMMQFEEQSKKVDRMELDRQEKVKKCIETIELRTQVIGSMIKDESWDAKAKADEQKAEIEIERLKNISLLKASQDEEKKKKLREEYRKALDDQIMQKQEQIEKERKENQEQPLEMSREEI